MNGINPDWDGRCDDCGGIADLAGDDLGCNCECPRCGQPTNGYGPCCPDDDPDVDWPDDVVYTHRSALRVLPADVARQISAVLHDIARTLRRLTSRRTR